MMDQDLMLTIAAGIVVVELILIQLTLKNLVLEVRTLRMQALEQLRSIDFHTERLVNPVE